MTSCMRTSRPGDISNTLFNKLELLNSFGNVYRESTQNFMFFTDTIAFAMNVRLSL